MRTTLITSLLLLVAVGFIAGCTEGQTSSNACTSTTQTDANGNPISTVGCGGN